MGLFYLGQNTQTTNATRVRVPRPRQFRRASDFVRRHSSLGLSNGTGQPKDGVKLAVTVIEIIKILIVSVLFEVRREVEFFAYRQGLVFRNFENAISREAEHIRLEFDCFGIPFYIRI